MYCIVLHCIALYCIVLYCIALYCIALHCIVLHCIILHCIVLYCIVLYCNVFWCTLYFTFSNEFLCSALVVRTFVNMWENYCPAPCNPSLQYLGTSNSVVVRMLLVCPLAMKRWHYFVFLPPSRIFVVYVSHQNMKVLTINR